MVSIVEQNIQKIKELCARHHVAKLFVFGSALTEDFNAGSDIDLVVDFQSMLPEQYADNYFDLKFSLQDLFKRKIDLLEEQAIRNPFLKQSIDTSKQLIYG